MTQKYREALSWFPTPQIILLGEETPKTSLVNNVITVSSAALRWRVCMGGRTIGGSSQARYNGPGPKRTEWLVAGRARGLDLPPAVWGSASVHIMVSLGSSCQCQVALTQGSGAEWHKLRTLCMHAHTHTAFSHGGEPVSHKNKQMSLAKIL